MLEIIKELYIFALLLLVFSYLVPKEDYKSYIQFFIGIFLLIVILRPVLTIVMSDSASELHEIFDNFNGQMEQMQEEKQWEAGTEDIYELFIFKGEGE